MKTTKQIILVLLFSDAATGMAAEMRPGFGILPLPLNFARQFKLLMGLMFGAALVVFGANHAFAQSIGFNFTTDSTWVGLYDNGESASSLAPTSVAGFVPQAYWLGFPI